MAKRKTKQEIEQDNKERAIKLRFTDWLYREYEISFLPKYFFINLDKVYKGTYKNLNKPVPVEDLWDMWQRKMPYLLRVYDKNKRMGKDMSGMSRINYDMAIVLSKYDSYLQWKEQQKQAFAEKQQTVEDNMIKMISTKTSQASTLSNNSFDISEILDEI